MKKTLSKFLVCLLIALLLTNYCLTNVAHANVLEAFTQGINAAWGVVIEAIEDILGTIVGIFAILPKAFVLPLALSAQSFMATIAYSQGVSDADGNIKNATFLNTDTWFLTPFDILFNKVALVDVNIFNIPSTPGAIKSIREAAAGWYYVMRTIAAAILLCVFIYVGIRMALSTVASDKAAYKKMLIDWIASLALIFLLQYIIVFTFAINTAFIKALEGVSRSNGISSAILKLYGSALLLDIDSIAATIVICMLTWQTFSLLISYATRMLKVTFLVIISPLITLTYSIDKMGDGKAQALNTWLKEFVYTVLLQPFHCIIYTAFIGIAMSILSGESGFVLPFMQYDNNNIGAAVLCILCIHFTKEAEKILGKIFNFSDSTSSASLAAGMTATALVASNAKNLGKGARNIVNGVKNSREFFTNAAITAGTVRGIMRGQTTEKAREEATANVHQFNERIDNSVDKVKAGVKNATNKVIDGTVVAATAKIFTARSNNKADQKRIEEKAEEIRNDTGVSKRKAMSQARAQVVKENRENKKERKNNNKEKTKENKRRIQEAVSFWKNSDTRKQLKNEVIPSMISMGTGVFVGAGSFGVGGNAIQSIMLGNAMSKGTNEFFKTSTNRLATEGADLMKGAGVTTREDAQKYIGGLAGREEQLKDASKELDKIYGQIAGALSKLDQKEQNQVKGTIKNIVEQSLLSDPTASNEDIMEKLGKNEIIASNFAKAGKDIKSFSGNFDKGINLQRDAKIYQNMANARDWGLKPGIMMDDMVRHFMPGEKSAESYSVHNVDTTPDDRLSGDSGENDTNNTNPPDKGNGPSDGTYNSSQNPDHESLTEEEKEEVERIVEDKFREMSDSEKDNYIKKLEQMLLQNSEESQTHIATLERMLSETQIDAKKVIEERETLENIIKKLRMARGGQ